MLVRCDDRYIRSLQIIFIPRNRPYILKHTISPGNIYRTNVLYYIPCHITFPPHRAIIPYRRHKYLPHQRTISHTVPYIIFTTPCHHTIPPTWIFTAPTYHITYRAIYYFHHTMASYHTTDVPYHIPCHTTHNAIPYHATYHTRPHHTIHAIPNEK